MDNTDRKLFILDTNVLLHEPSPSTRFKEHDVLIPMTVLEELDNIRIARRTSAVMPASPSRALEDVFRDATPEQIVGEWHWPARRAAVSPSSAITICPRMPRCSPTRRRTTASSTPPLPAKARDEASGGAGHQRHQHAPQGKEQVLPMWRITAATSSSTTSACSPRASRWCPAASGSGSASATAKPMAATHGPRHRCQPAGGESHVNQYLLDEENFFAARVLSHDGNKIRLKISAASG